MACLESMVEAALRTRPVFTTGALPNTGARWHAVPWHMTLWLRSDTAYVAEPTVPLAFESWTNRMDVYLAITFKAYAKTRMDRAGYEAAHGRLDRARELMIEARGFDPHIRPEDVAPQPLAADRTVLRVAEYFHALEAAPESKR